MSLTRTNVNSYPPVEIDLCPIDQRDWDDLFKKIMKNNIWNQILFMISPVLLGTGIPILFDKSKYWIGVILLIVGVIGSATSLIKETNQTDKIQDRAEFIDNKSKDFVKQYQDYCEKHKDE